MYSKDLKQKAINLYKKLNSIRLVANLLEIGKSTIHRWITLGDSKKEKVNYDHICSFIKNILNKNKFIRLKDLQYKIIKKFNHKYSLSFIYTLIRKKLQYSYKKVNNKLYSNSIDNLQIKQKEFKDTIKNINIDKIISIDETYIYSNHSLIYGWNKTGERLIHYKKSNPVKYSIIMAINNKKIISFKMYKTNINKYIFKQFMFNLNKIYTNNYFLMDNVSFHKSKIIIDIFINSTNKLLFIPPYSPQFNPIEEVFSQFKRNFLYKNYMFNITSSIMLSLKTILPSHLENYYKHSFLKLI